METKTSQAVSLYNAGHYKESFAIFKTFKLGVTKQERRTLQMAHEIAGVGREFYQQLGYDTKKIMNQAHAIVKKLWL